MDINVYLLELFLVISLLKTIEILNSHPYFPFYSPFEFELYGNDGIFIPIAATAVKYAKNMKNVYVQLVIHVFL